MTKPSTIIFDLLHYFCYSAKMTLNETLTAAVNAFSLSGYQSPEQLDYWMARLRAAATAELISESQLQNMLKRSLKAVYDKQVERGAILAEHPDLPRFTLDQVKPQLRRELDKRIMASADIIKLNRDKAVEQTLQRFSGWATSIPQSGSKLVDKVEQKTAIRKSFSALPFEERRVLIDQGHKLTAAISDVLAKDSGAIAAEWRSNWRQKGYNYRPDHKERDRKIYLLKSSWARDKGLVKPGPNGCYEDITAAGQEPFCRCHIRWVYGISGLPEDMVTAKGRIVLDEFKATL
jgi:hypothetical protein